MKPICKIVGAVTILFLMFIVDIPYLSEKLVPEAQALRGRGAAFVVGAAVGSASASSASASTATSQQQAATAQQQATTAQQQSATAQQQAQQQAVASQQQAASSGQPLPLGTVVSALPAGCTSTPVGGVNYYYCGGNFYEAKYQGSTLVYVTTKPK
jgi:hypothetical protein